MKVLRLLAGSLLGKWEAFKGARSFKVVNIQQNPIESYKIIASDGSVIEIFCHELNYRLVYQAWWVRNRRITMYRVYCLCSDNTPAGIKARLNDDFVIAQFLHPLHHRTAQKKAVIDSYVDLILSRFNT